MTSHFTEKFLDFIRRFIAGSDEGGEWIVKYMAWCAQHPDEDPGSGIMLTNQHPEAKKVFIHMLRKLFGARVEVTYPGNDIVAVAILPRKAE